MGRVSEHPVLHVPELETIDFFFEGAPLTARRGEVISSALFAHGITTFGLHPEDGSPQGIFCANGQCSQCMVIADGEPVKACMATVRPGMQVQKLVNLPATPEIDREKVSFAEIEDLSCDLLVIGGGPSGLGAAIEAADAGLSVIVVDDKDEAGGKLVLQTHTFFGSVHQCYAGTRGIEIARILSADAAKRRNIRMMTSTMAVGVYSDSKVGVVRGDRYMLVSPKSMLVAAGAREKALVFPGADLPGVYGAGAFQTLLNRDLVRPSEKLFIVGGGNVGLIAAYHAMQAGIGVVGLIEGLPEVGGYWVHADKIRRLGVPIYTSTTVVSANGEGAVESVTVAEVDENWKIRPGTYRTYPCDTLLIAVGLEPVNELYETALRFGMKAYVAGDAEEIAEASAAMFSGRTVGRTIARDLGRDVEVPDRWLEMTSTLKSHPGRQDFPVLLPKNGTRVFPVLWCVETIPCNPCVEACSHGSISVPDDGNILSRFEFTGECHACGKCVAACPGLAITLVDLREREGGKALVTIPWEMAVDFEIGDRKTAVGRKGEVIGEGVVAEILDKRGRAPCSAACPAGVRAQGYIELIRKGSYDEAIALLRRDLPLPSVCGRVCYQPCEADCVRGEVDETIAILNLKRFVSDWALARDERIAPAPVTHEERVAVVGSGPSGLACANELLHRGYGVTVFESAEKAGGMLRYGIPQYRLPDPVLDGELGVLEKRGIEIRTGERISGYRELMDGPFDAVYLACGAQASTRLGIEGEELGNVTGMLEFLRAVNSGERTTLTGKVAIIGGGNSAIDSARAAVRLGAEEVRIVYRRSREEMPAHDWEIEEAEKEGVLFEYLAAPVKVLGRKVAEKLVCQRMELGKPDESGRRRPVPVKGSEYEIDVDHLVPAIGQRADLGGVGDGVRTTDWGTIEADPVTQETGVDGLFAGGDVVTGPSTVVEAFGAGKRAAESIDLHLTGGDLKRDREMTIPVSKAIRSEGEGRRERVVPASLPVGERVKGFGEVVAAFTEEEARAEADRCLGCGASCETFGREPGTDRYDSSVMVVLEVDAPSATKIAGIRAQDEEITRPIETVMPPDCDDDVVVCRCERVALGPIRDAIRDGVRDMNQLKAMFEAGLGACGGKTCGSLIHAIFRREGVPPEEVTGYTHRPLVAEVPLGSFAGAGGDDTGDDGDEEGGAK